MIMVSPFKECPRFNFCSVNICPLDPDIELRNRLTGEQNCTMEKQIRKRIGIKYPNLLQYQGLTKREYNGKQRWDNLSPIAKGIIRKSLLTRLSKWQKNTKTSPSMG